MYWTIHLFVLAPPPCRSDFMEIVRDLHSRAAAYEQSRPKVSYMRIAFVKAMGILQLHNPNTLFVC